MFVVKRSAALLACTCLAVGCIFGAAVAAADTAAADTKFEVNMLPGHGVSTTNEATYDPWTLGSQHGFGGMQ